MVVEYEGMREIADFVVPTVEDAPRLIADGAINKIDLLERAGLKTPDAEAALRGLDFASGGDDPSADRF